MTRPTTQPGLGTNDQAGSADSTLSHNTHFSRERNQEFDHRSDMPSPTPQSTNTKLPPSHSIPKPLVATPDPFEEDLDRNPHSHFLSPVHMYESWDDSDDSDDDGSYELDAGITDFALFTDDYTRAKEQDLPLSDKWDDFVASQEQCLDRAVARSRAELATRPTAPFYSGSSFPAPGEAVPSLTPDTSPKLADDLEYDDSAESESESKPKPYRTQIVVPDPTPSSPPINIPQRKQIPSITLTSAAADASSAIDETSFADPATPAFLLYRQRQRAEKRRKDLAQQPSSPQQQGQQQLPPVRPGLSAGSRTLSGKLHVWRRPSWGLWSVDEEDEAGEKAEGIEVSAGEQGALRRKKGRSELRA